MIDVRS